MVGKVNKHIAWLGLAADVFLLKAVFDFMSFSLIVERHEEVDAEVLGVHWENDPVGIGWEHEVMHTYMRGGGRGSRQMLRIC